MLFPRSHKVIKDSGWQLHCLVLTRRKGDSMAVHTFVFIKHSWQSMCHDLHRFWKLSRPHPLLWIWEVPLSQSSVPSQCSNCNFCYLKERMHFCGSLAYTFLLNKSHLCLTNKTNSMKSVSLKFFTTVNVSCLLTFLPFPFLIHR